LNPTTPNTKPETSATPDGPAAPKNAAGEDRLTAMGWLPCSVTLEVPAARFTIEKLLKLSTGMLVETDLPEGKSVPVQVNGKEIALSDIETVGDNLAFRVTEIL